MAISFGQSSVGRYVGGLPSSATMPASQPGNTVDQWKTLLSAGSKGTPKAKSPQAAAIGVDGGGVGSVSGSEVASSGGGGLAELEPMASPAISALQNRTPASDPPPMMFQARPGPPGTNPNLGQRMPAFSMQQLRARVY